MSSVDQELESAIVDCLRQRGRHKTICPSEAARKVRPDRWRELMEQTRCAARRMAAEGRLEFIQGGRVVDPSHARGAIRLRKGEGLL